MYKYVLTFAAVLVVAAAGLLALGVVDLDSQDRDGLDGRDSRESLDKLRSLYQEAAAAAQAGEYAKANDRLAEVLRLLPPPKDGSIDPNRARVYYELAANHARLGERQEALERLGRAVDAGYWNAQFLSADAAFSKLRSEKAFAEVLERARLGIGSIAFGLTDVNGKEIRKEDHKDKVLVIDVWGTWCPPCRMQIPHFIKLQERYGKRGVAVIGLASERVPPERARDVVAEFVTGNGINYPVALIPPAVLASVTPPVRSFPTTLYVGRDGIVADRAVGYESYERIEQRVLKVLANQAEAKEPLTGR